MDRMVIAGGYGICLFSADTLQDFLKREKIRKRKLLSLLQKDKELYLNTQREGIFIPLVGIDHYNYAIKLEGQDEPFDDQWVQKISYEGFNLEVKDGLWISAIEQLEPFEPKEYHIKEEEFYTTPGYFGSVEHYHSPWERWYKSETPDVICTIYTDIKYNVPAGKYLVLAANSVTTPNTGQMSCGLGASSGTLIGENTTRTESTSGGGVVNFAYLDTDNISTIKTSGYGYNDESYMYRSILVAIRL